MTYLHLTHRNLARLYSTTELNPSYVTTLIYGLAKHLKQSTCKSSIMKQTTKIGMEINEDMNKIMTPWQLFSALKAQAMKPSATGVGASKLTYTEHQSEA